MRIVVYFTQIIVSMGCPMNVSVSQSLLSQALSVVSRAVSSRSTMSILENILLTTETDKICLSATDLELAIKYWIPATVEDEGSITVPSKTFCDLVSTLPEDTVNLRLNEQNQTLTIRCLQLVTDIKGLDASEFPPMPEFEEKEAVSFEMQDLKKMINQVAFAASTDESRPVLHGVKMTVDGKEMTMAATDGFRIAIKKNVLKEGLGLPISAIIPASALRELARISGAADKNVQMMLSNSKSQVVFKLESVELASQLIAGDFVDYQAIVPKTFKTTTIVSTASLQKACSQAGVIARENKNLIRLDINGAEEGSGKISITALAEQTGSTENYIEANVDGEDLSIAFNVRFLREALDVIDSPNIALQTNAGMSPAMIQPLDDENDYKYVIMPMHFG